MTLPLLAIGFLSILGQVILLRELSVALYGVELIYILAMAVWLFWSAVGAMIGPRFLVPETKTVGRIFSGFALLFFGDVLFIRYFRTLAGATTGTFLPFPIQLILLFISLLPTGVIMGLLFQWCGKIWIAAGGRLSRAYGIESAGGVMGGIAATLMFMGGIRNLTAAWLCAGIAAIVWNHLCFRKVARRIGGIALVTLLAAGFFGMPALDVATTRWNHPDLVAVRDSPYGRLTLIRQSDQFVLFENDVLGFETQNIDAESLVHLAALSLPRIRKAAVLGGGMEGLLEELLHHHPETVDYVELNPRLISLTTRYLPEKMTGALRDPAARIIRDDPRRFLRDAAQYDLILVGMPQPDSGAANRFYTREFFRLCRQRLTPGGVLAFRLRASENVWSPMMARRNAAVWHALKLTFPDAVALPGTSLILLAANGAEIPDPDVLIQRLESRNIRPRLVSAPYIRYLFTNDRFQEMQSLLNAPDVTPNTDARPVSYHYSVLIWLSKFFPELMHRSISDTVHGAAAGVGILTFGLAAWIAKRSPRWRRGFRMGAAGFIGMVLETLMLLHYQSAQGVLYQNIGCLITAFMAGLWAGAETTPRLPDRPQAWTSNVRMFFILMAGLSLLPAGMILVGLPPTLLTASLFLFLTGGAVAGVFVTSGTGNAADQQRAASEIYAADLTGGCFGAVVGSLWLIPFWGMLPTAGAMAGLSLLAMLPGNR